MNDNHDELGRFASAEGLGMSPIAADKTKAAVAASKIANAKSGTSQDHLTAAALHRDAADSHQGNAMAQGSSAVGRDHSKLADLHRQAAAAHVKASKGKYTPPSKYGNTART